MKIAPVLLSLLGLFFVYQVPSTQSARILGLFAHPGKSHFDFFHPLFKGLAVNNDVTVISYFPNQVPMANYTDIELSGMPIFADFVDLKNFDGDSHSLPFKIPTFFMLHEWGMKVCEVAFNSPAIKNLLSDPRQNYDVVILEQFNNDCMMAIAHQLKAPVIALSSCAIMSWHFQRMGSPFIPSFMPMNFLPYTDEMNFMARVNNFFHFHTVNLMYNFITQRATNALIRKHFGPTIPPVEQLVSSTSLMLINQHFSLTGVMPYSPNVVEVGGLQIRSEYMPLKSKLKSLVKASVNGVIYISWGSMIRPETLPNDKRDAIFKAISQFPEYTFLMKWSNETLTNKPQNLHTFTWMPQRDVLCHPHVKAFMTHGGLLGTSEAVYCGVPMVVTPFYGDQFLNSVAIEKRKLGVIVQYKDFTEENIVKSLKAILADNFSKEVQLLSKAYKNRPIKPLDLAIWWVEHIIETNGAPWAQSSSKHINWFIHNSFDVYLFLSAIMLVLITFARIIFKKSFSKSSTKTKDKLKLQ